MTSLILASTSPARRSLMDGLGLRYQAISPDVDEDVPLGTSVEAAVSILAERKAKAVSARFPDALVLGADQLLSLDGRPIGKPANREAARAQLRSISGCRHSLYTGICLCGPGVFAREVDAVQMTVFPLSDSEVDGYLNTEEWVGCAGAYRIEGRGQALFSAIDGDRTSVQGLPMLRVVRLLRAHGVSFFTV